MVVNVEIDEDVAVVTVDNPPVNATGIDVRRGLWDAVTETERNPDVRAVVLTCAGRTFIAGADIREFGKPPEEPHLPDVLMRIEGASKPWVAAIHGSALGGGLETAMACHARIATVDARLGLPEVTLGLIPGAGGTVRLPRLVGPVTAMRMAATGKAIGADEAIAEGLIDRIADGNLRAEAVDFARQAAVRRTLALDAHEDEEFDQHAEKVLRKARGQVAPREAVDAVRRALTLSADDALAAEREAFLRLRQHPQSAALRHVFFAERATANELDIGTARPIEHIGVVGGGTMGAGISAACVLAGLNVVMAERDQAAANKGRSAVGKILEGSHARGLVTKEELREHRSRFAASTTMDDLASADLVIEAVFEDRDVKREVFAALDAIAKPEAILATNTSYLDVGAIAAATSQPSRVIGLHFFSPAHIMKLLEVVVPDGAAPDAVATGAALAKRLRKTAVRSGVCDGFIANRVMSAYRREAEYMLEDGAMPWDVDAAMVAFGFPMGVFAMADLAGLDISWAMRKRRAATRDPSERYVDIADRLCEAGHFGRKTGRGYYDYDAEGRGTPSPETEALVLAESRRKGIERRDFDPDAIMARLLEAMQSEGRAILDEGIARKSSDIDVAMILGFGFPRWRGGPMYMADNR